MRCPLWTILKSTIRPSRNASMRNILTSRPCPKRTLPTSGKFMVLAPLFARQLLISCVHIRYQNIRGGCAAPCCLVCSLWLRRTSDEYGAVRALFLPGPHTNTDTIDQKIRVHRANPNSTTGCCGRTLWERRVGDS